MLLAGRAAYGIPLLAGEGVAELPLDDAAEGYLAMDERRAIKTLLRP